MKKSVEKLIFIFFLFIPSLKAEIIMDKVIIDFMPHQPKQQNVVVYDSGKETAYVDTEIFEILNPGMEDQKRVPINKKSKNRLIVAPQRLTINPNMRKRLQFIVGNEKLEQDKIYRVTVSPKVAGIKSKNAIGIKILIGYDVLVIVRPEKLDFNIKISRSKNNITFENLGNTNVLLENITQCDNIGKCQTILSDRLYSGNKITAKLLYKNKPIFADIYYGNELKKAKY